MMSKSHSNARSDSRDDHGSHEPHDHDNDWDSGEGLQGEELRLYNAKRERQRAEESAQRLENRVLLLEKERLKVLKKIDDVKKKALEIMRVKQRAQEEEALRRDLEDKKQEDLQLRQLKIHEMRTEHEERLNTSKFNSMTNSLVLAKTTKESLKVS